MTGSRLAAVPGAHIASWTASLAVAMPLASFAGGSQLHGLLRGPDLRVARAACSSPCRCVRASAASTRDRTGPAPPALLQLLRSLAQQDEQLGVQRARSVPEHLHAERRRREPDGIGGRPAGRDDLLQALRGQAGLPLAASYDAASWSRISVRWPTGLSSSVICRARR